MKVAELIIELKKCPQDADVVFFVEWGREIPVEEVSPEDSGGNVVLGNSLPPEIYARDFKYD